MSRKKRESIQFRYYDLPQKEHCLAMLGQGWVRAYGDGVDYLHFHNLLEIGYCRQGTGTLTLGDRDVPYEPGMISVIPKNYLHTTNSTEGTTSFWEFLFLDPEELLQALYPDNVQYARELLSLVNRQALFDSQSRYPQLTAIVLAIMEEMRYKQKFYIEAVQELLRALIFEIARQEDGDMEQDAEPAEFSGAGKKSGMAAILPSLHFIESRFAESIRIAELAELCNMSETHFRRLFGEYMGMKPVEYINTVRIRMACEQMRHTDDSMNDIAARCGFVTASTFNRNFRKIIGVTPYQWKKKPENFESSLLKFHISAEKGW